VPITAWLLTAAFDIIWLIAQPSWAAYGAFVTVIAGLLGALGACTAMTLRMYARMKKWPLHKVRVQLTHDKIYAKDCAECETKEGKIDKIERTITLDGPLSEEQRTRLLEIAERCPVHKTLTSEIRIATRLA